LEVFFEFGVDLTSANPHGFTALHFAAASGKENVLKFLLDTHFKSLVDLKTWCYNPNTYGLDYEDLYETYPSNDSALHLAARHGHLSSVEILVKAGAIVNAKNVYGNTPLHVRKEMAVLLQFKFCKLIYLDNLICLLLSDIK
jgi:ankyrin repeat protein